jgi:tetratricopeptide (TPR) repeat protein
MILADWKAIAGGTVVVATMLAAGAVSAADATTNSPSVAPDERMRSRYGVPEGAARTLTNRAIRAGSPGALQSTNTRPRWVPPGLPDVDPKTAAGVWEVFRRGRYLEATQLAEKGFADSSRDEEWGLVLANTHLAVGRYTNALSVVTNALARNRTSVRLRLVGHEAAQFSGQPDKAREFLDEIRMVVSGREWAYREPANLVALGRAALLMGSDPRTVLTQVYDRAKTDDPNCREAYQAAGDLALDKGDYQLASKSFGEGLRKFPEDPDLHGGLARAFAPSDAEQMIESVSAALELNPNHIASLLLLADHLIVAEEFEEAEAKLAQALKVNTHRPEAWAYRAVIAHLKNDAAAEKRARDAALRTFRANPAVDHLIGEKLSRNYRFAEGATYQRQALRFDPDYLPAKIQLAQDLLRLGQENEGWRLAAEVQRRDNYHVEAFNLVTPRTRWRSSRRSPTSILSSAWGPTKPGSTVRGRCGCSSRRARTSPLGTACNWRGRSRSRSSRSKRTLRCGPSACPTIPDSWASASGAW